MSWWALIVGVGMILVGLRWCITRKIKRSLLPFSRESHYLTGAPAFSCGVIAIANGILLILVNLEFMQVDRCLDLGGAYNYESNSCSSSSENL
ncbi:hypothetical protein Q2E61_00495 [Microbulbifer thermotolerans]|uniref:hypothetical protein n=1 Tax=Microbulbifer thermotolerans TaxID=252514 RepID=UPI002673BE2E|nr:hypothetical protein [Microbulbifer thermotolerans]WKT60710.1 hypothetical protein Q2E61_00495 [Microbulbifer thermotolerans]